MEKSHDAFLQGAQLELKKEMATLQKKILMDTVSRVRLQQSKEGDRATFFGQGCCDRVGNQQAGWGSAPSLAQHSWRHCRRVNNIFLKSTTKSVADIFFPIRSLLMRCNCFHSSSRRWPQSASHCSPCSTSGVPVKGLGFILKVFHVAPSFCALYTSWSGPECSSTLSIHVGEKIQIKTGCIPSVKKPADCSLPFTYKGRTHFQTFIFDVWF